MTPAIAQIDSPIGSMPTGAVSKPIGSDNLDPRMMRWIFIPIHGISGLPPTAFATDHLLPNKFLPLREFQFPVTNLNDEQEVKTKLPGEQVMDFQIMAAERGGVLLDALSRLDNREKQERIISVLANPTVCTKYQFKLRNSCATCWRDYLISPECSKRMADAFADDEVMLIAAQETWEQLLNAIEKALLRSENLILEALEELDNPQTGKKSLTEPDYLNLWHSHKNPPERKTTVTPQEQMSKLTDAIAGLAINQGNQSLSSADVKAMIAESFAEKEAEIAQLKQQLEAFKDAGESAQTPNTKKGKE